MALIQEGPLSKWTNVVKGWQYRWFVLDSNTGILSYYTSKAKMVRGSRRGCLQLANGVIGINNQEDSTFTISCADNKTYHFQARNQEERDMWIQSLQAAINQRQSSSGGVMPLPTAQPVEPWQDKLESEFCEAEGYHRLLDQQVVKLETQVSGHNGAAESAECKNVLDTSRALVDTIRQCLDMMQEVKTQLKSLEHGGMSVTSSLGATASVASVSTAASANTTLPEAAASDAGQPPSAKQGVSDLASPTVVPEDGASATSAKTDEQAPLAASQEEDSESDSDEEFFEANEEMEGMEDSTGQAGAGQEEPAVYEGDAASASSNVYIARGGVRLLPDTIRTEKDNLEAGMESNKSIITHLLSQVRIGMDLTKVVLPTFILEKRSMLEMYADFFAHSDLYASIPDYDDAQDRFVEVVRWYVSAFHAGRQSSLVKKPYNPILGETFQCMWDVGGRTEPGAGDVPQNVIASGPVAWATENAVAFIAEQVSHHPPVAAFYAELAAKKISVNGHIWTKSKFLGLAVCAQMVGEARVRLHSRGGEEYIITFPTAYARSILTTPWMEMGGHCTIECPTTGYSSSIDFHCKPFYGGKRDRLTAELSHVSGKKPFMTLDGLWNATIDYKTATTSGVFVDTKKLEIMKKLVRPLEDQGEFESRRLWDDVTENLLTENIEAATEFKAKLEERQRREAKERKEQGEEWVHKLFHPVGSGYEYNTPIDMRLAEHQSA